MAADADGWRIPHGGESRPEINRDIDLCDGDRTVDDDVDGSLEVSGTEHWPRLHLIGEKTLEINIDDDIDHSDADEDATIDDDSVDGEDAVNDNGKEGQQTCTKAIQQNLGNYNPPSAPLPPSPASSVGISLFRLKSISLNAYFG